VGPERSNEPVNDSGDGRASGPGPDPGADDRAIMAAVAAGELGALDRLYEQHGAMAYSIALRITGDPATAEDVVQDAFIGAWRNASRYAGERGSVRTWLLSIVHHRAIDAVRRRRASSALPEPEGPLPEALTLPDAWSDVEARLDGAAVRTALAAIPVAQREVIELAYFGGLTQAEIASQLAVPLGTVKSRIRLGLVALRAELGLGGHDG